MMSMRIFAVGLLVAGAAAVASAPPADAAACPFTGPHTFHWAGGNGHWYQHQNSQHQGVGWSEGAVPGQYDSTAATDYACINNGATVSLVNSPLAEEVGLAAIYVGNGSHVIVEHGRFLFLNGTSQPSIVRAGSTIADDSGSLGGVGTLQVAGAVTVSDSSGAPALASRKCAEYHNCTGTASGTLQVERGGTLTITGPTNFTDRYSIVNEGTLMLTGAGYLAGDWGTSIKNENTIDIANDLGLYEGNHPAKTHHPWLINYGELAKTAGSGTSVIGLQYIPKKGSTINVHSGTLVIGGSTVPAATVDPGRTYGNGGCPANTPCQDTTNTGHIQTTKVALPTTSRAGQVKIAQSAPPTTYPNAIGQSITVGTHGVNATVRHPMRYTFSFLLGATHGRLKATNWRDARVYTFVAGAYKQIRSCLHDGTPRPGPVRACIDLRNTNGSSSLSNGVAHYVVRTLPYSRWVVV